MWYFEFQRILSLNHPTEGAIAWEMELEALKERGVEQIDLGLRVKYTPEIGFNLLKFIPLYHIISL